MPPAWGIYVEEEMADTVFFFSSGVSKKSDEASEDAFLIVDRTERHLNSGGEKRISFPSDLARWVSKNRSKFLCLSSC